MKTSDIIELRVAIDEYIEAKCWLDRAMRRERTAKIKWDEVMDRLTEKVEGDATCAAQRSEENAAGKGDGT